MEVEATIMMSKSKYGPYIYAITMFLLIVLLPFGFMVSYFDLNGADHNITLGRNLKFMTLIVVPLVFLFMYLLVRRYRKTVKITLNEKILSVSQKDTSLINERMDEFSSITIEKRQNVKNGPIGYVVGFELCNTYFVMKSILEKKSFDLFESFAIELLSQLKINDNFKCIESESNRRKISEFKRIIVHD